MQINCFVRLATSCGFLCIERPIADGECNVSENKRSNTYELRYSRVYAVHECSSTYVQYSMTISNVASPDSAFKSPPVHVK